MTDEDKDKDKPKRIAISKAHRELLRAEMARTGAGPQQVLRGQSRKMPRGLSSALIRNWADGRAQTARRDYWEWVLDRYAKYRPDPALVSLTPDMKTDLDAEIRRTQIAPAKLFWTVGEATTPSGLKPHSVRNWLSYPQQLVRESDYRWVIENYRAMPDGPRRIRLDPAMIGSLKREAIRTGASGHTLLKKSAAPTPDELTPVMVNRWLSGKGESVRSDHWEFVIGAYARLPDAPRGKQHVKLAERTPISQEFIEKLQTWRTACLLPSYILRTPDIPPGLKPATISNWLNGTSATALPDHIAFVACRCEAALADPEFRVLIDKATRTNIRGGWLSLSKLERGKLTPAERETIENILADTLFLVHPAELLHLRQTIQA